jgi:gliding motility-associated-like protein
MKIMQKFLLIILAILPLSALSQEATPTVSPTALYVDSVGVTQEVTKINDGEAPLEVTFRPNPSNMGDHTPAYEWHFSKQGEEGEFLVRYEEETTYRFVESGTFNINLRVTLTDTGEQLDSASITTLVVAISESKLEFPNAFSPNGDEFNQIYKAKKGYKSIVEFHAYIFNRWGQKLFEWTDPAEGWDGTYKGNPVKEGVYFVLVKAKGADGHVYNIRKDVNLLRGFTETGNSTSSSENP